CLSGRIESRSRASGVPAMQYPTWAALAVCLIGASSSPAAEVHWQGVARAAQALLPEQPEGEKPILDALEKRARDALAKLEHPTDRLSWERAVPELRRRL